MINEPYKTYRRLVNEDVYQLILIFGFIAIYFFLVSPLKTHSLHPFLVTVKASKLFTTVFLTYLMICGLLFVLGRYLSDKIKLKSILIAWGYSLIPTLLWFLTTSFFYVFLPPPRHATIPGKIFSVVFVAFSIALLFWKALLYYLTLRFALRLDLFKIMGVSLILIPTLFAYSVWLFQIGIFKVPFI